MNTPQPARFFGISHVDVQTTDIEKALVFWRDTIGLNQVKRGQGFADLDSGNVVLRLVEVGMVERAAAVRVHVPDVQAAFDALVTAGAAPLYAPMRTPALEQVASVRAPDGHSVLVWRELTEDEYGFTPDLPKQGQWHDEAEKLLVSLLSCVPALFRALARRKVTKVVEELAGYDRSPVTREHVIRGYIMASAKVTRYRLVEPLRRNGIDPDRYRSEFDA
jgi:catechol 2,3-dioxygenase-like lactoylglutathione lyase family enzyme